MDEMVLQAQKWVNLMYGNNVGFQKAPENGKTGWQTMFALTMGLQIELGITTLAPSFGPTTLAKLTEKFPKIGTGTNTPKNVVKLIQSGMYCKGYDGGDINGDFSKITEAGVKKLQGHIGSSQSNGIITPKLFKALLNMDAYISVMNGSEKIRSIQQWLNKTYIHRREFFYMPYDGHFSRDVQKYLMYAIQYEIGMNDDTANGNFGPGTQAGIKQNQLKQGDSDTSHKFVHLFQAAMTFNGWEVSFDGTFSSQVATKVKEFQHFSLLSVNGQGNFQTWASLLVSTGDTERRGQACDCVTEITQSRAQTLLSKGYQIVGRYLTNVEGSSLNKKIQPGELDTIFNSGLRLFPIYQTYGGEADYFSETQGREDAELAYKAALKYGFNQGTIIYFAVDYDATDEEIQMNILPHFKGINKKIKELGLNYRVGIYGSRNVCIQVSAENLAITSFVSGMSTGFSGNLGFPLPSNWAFDQISTITIGSGESLIEIDNNIYSGRDKGVDNVNGSNDLNSDFMTYLGKVEKLAKEYILKTGTNKESHKLVAEFFREPSYSGIEWDIVAGKIDKEFVQYVKENGGQRYDTIIDLETFISFDVAHLFAAMDGVFYNGIPQPYEATLADGAGWMGDLITTLVDYKNHKGEYDSAYTLAMDYIAATKVDGFYNLDDYIQDIDGWNLAYRTLNLGSDTLAYSVKQYYEKFTLNRYNYFFETRHANDTDYLLESVSHAYADSPTTLIGAFRIALLLKNGALDTDFNVQVKSDIIKAYVDILKNKLDN